MRVHGILSRSRMPEKMHTCDPGICDSFCACIYSSGLSLYLGLCIHATTPETVRVSSKEKERWKNEASKLCCKSIYYTEAYL
jgi:hypothetical protein